MKKIKTTTGGISEMIESGGCVTPVRCWLKRKFQVFLALLNFAVMVGMLYLLVLALTGCGPRPIAVANSLIVAQPAGWAGEVRIAQMGQSCVSQRIFIEESLATILIANSIPEPTTIEVRLLGGSSLCGDMQGVANLAGTQSAGARNTAVASVVVRWAYILPHDLDRAQKILWDMAPTSHKK